jgi:DHA1 family bicyclomycin/chloramphenicol resistance-like MFS transporter
MKKFKLIWLLAPMVMSMPFAIDTNIPAFPSIAAKFGINAGVMQLTLTLFMLTAGFVQLVIGPLSDSYGRRRISYYSLFVFTVGIILCASANSISQLIMFRIIEAAGSCGLFVLSFALVRDFFSGKDSAECYTYLNGVVAFSPIFAPFIGSMIDIHFGWRFTFLFLLLLVLFSLISLSNFPSNSYITQEKQKGKSLFKEYIQISTDKNFMKYTLISAISFLYSYLFCSMSPYIIIYLLHISEAYYGYYFAFMGVSLLIGSFTSGFIIEKIGVIPTCVFGCTLSLIGSIIMLIWYYMTGLTINNFIWPMLIIGIGGVYSMGTAIGLSMESFGKNAGAAAGLGGALRFLIVGILGSLLINKNIESTLPLSLTAIGASCISLTLIFLTWLKKTTTKD